MSDLDARLQAWGRAEAEAAGDAPTFDVSARRTHRAAALLATAAALLVAAGGVAVLTQSSFSPTRPGTDRHVVPWAPLPPPQPGPDQPSRPADDPRVRPCTATDLRASAPNPGEGATGNWVASFELTNASTTPCRLTGQLDGLSGVLHGTRQTIQVTHPKGILDMVPGVLAAGRSGQLRYLYYRRCDTTQPARTPVYRDLQLTLLGGTVPVPGASLDLGCDSPAVGVGAGQLGVPPEQPPTTPHTPPLAPTLRAPASVQAGQRLRYTVTLSNATDEPVALDPCPGYLQALLAGDVLVNKETWGLNCAQAQPIPAHGSETFAMELVVPADAQPGARLLTWQLASADAASGRAIVEVTNTEAPSPTPSATPPSGTDVVGLDIDAALLRLQQADCSAAVEAIVNGAAPVGQVVSQHRTSDVCEMGLTVSAGPRSSAPVCTTLTITAGEVGVGLGHVGFSVRFRNSGSGACSLTGYPAVSATDSKTGRTVTARHTPSGYLGGTSLPVATYFLAPGEEVSALVEGTDNPAGNAASCADLTHLRVTVNGSSAPLDRVLSNCSGLEVHPFVPGTTGHA